MDFEKRKDKLADSLTKSSSKVDCVLITSLPNLKYYFNYAGAAYERFCGGFLSLKERKSALVIPKLDEGKAASSSVDGVFGWTDSEGYADAIEEALKSIGGKARNFGCEDWITLSSMNAVKKVRETAKFESISPTISDQRLIKSKDEIDALRSSAAKLSKGYENLPEILRAGRSEKEAAFEVQRALTDAGTNLDFCGLQSGPNSAVPHSLTSSRKFSQGDMIVVDISATDESGYYADFTRTFCVGNPSEEQRRVYDIVKNAQSKGVNSASPGVTAKALDRDVRAIIEKSGYGEYFVHRTGHGLGLEVHEAPWISGLNSSMLRQGMVFTVEPGIYLPGKFGVRIEDNVALNSSGPENLTKVTHDLIEV
jgi:Xaa-Pro aminopeptidase